MTRIPPAPDDLVVVLGRPLLVMLSQRKLTLLGRHLPRPRNARRDSPNAQLTRTVIISLCSGNEVPRKGLFAHEAHRAACGGRHLQARPSQAVRAQLLGVRRHCFTRASLLFKRYL
jgi:hypothetical protein